MTITITINMLTDRLETLEEHVIQTNIGRRSHQRIKILMKTIKSGESGI